VAARLPELFAQFGAAPRRICDLACGTGDAAVHLARRGYRVVGVDASPAMLEEARRLAEAVGVHVEWIQADARAFALPEPVDAVTCFFDALNYLETPKDLSAAFCRVAEALRPGGLFVFDMNTRAGLAEAWGSVDRVETPDEGLYVIWQSRHDYETDVNTVVLTAFVAEPDGRYRRIREVHRERAYPIAQVRELLGCAGLDVLALGDLQLEPLRPDASRFLCVARRRGERPS
jgi:SAM-dependent methyltransferase